MPRPAAVVRPDICPRTLDHLPAGKRDELRFVEDLLTAGFDEERSTRWAQHLC